MYMCVRACVCIVSPYAECFECFSSNNICTFEANNFIPKRETTMQCVRNNHESRIPSSSSLSIPRWFCANSCRYRCSTYFKQRTRGDCALIPLEDNFMKELLTETKPRETRNSRKRANARARAPVYHTGRNTRVSHYDVQRAHARPTHNPIVEGIPCLLEDLASSWLGFSLSSSLVDYTWHAAFVTTLMPYLRAEETRKKVLFEGGFNLVRRTHCWRGSAEKSASEIRFRIGRRIITNL